MDTITLQHPQLWSCESPYLYTAIVTIYNRQHQPLDQVSQSFGVRTIAFSPQYGLRINGKKVYGENNVKDEADFRARVKAEIEANMAEDAKYKFGLDAKAAVMKKMEGLQFPEAFLKRWVLATNEKMTQEELDKDFPKMLEELKWHLAKDQLMKAFEVKVEKE